MTRVSFSCSHLLLSRFPCQCQCDLKFYGFMMVLRFVDLLLLHSSLIFLNFHALKHLMIRVWFQNRTQNYDRTPSPGQHGLKWLMKMVDLRCLSPVSELVTAVCSQWPGKTRLFIVTLDAFLMDANSSASPQCKIIAHCLRTLTDPKSLILAFCPFFCGSYSPNLKGNASPNGIKDPKHHPR